MKRISIALLGVCLLTSCSGWSFDASPYNGPTPFRQPTRTPSVVTATPSFGASSPSPTLAVSSATIAINTETPLAVLTDTPVFLPSDTATLQPTAFIPVLAVGVEVLGCNTSLDITHGLGEVTNAYITLTNTGNVDLLNLKATLFALDEGREHPDKTVEVALLPAAQKITIKLTVDSTYNEETPVQIEVSAEGGLFQRLGEDSCRDIGILAPDPASLNTPVPVNP